MEHVDFNTQSMLFSNDLIEVKYTRFGYMAYLKNDIFVGQALARYGEYCFTEYEIFKQIVKPGQIVVDAGANVGAHTLVFWRLVGPNGCVYAFEPQPVVFEILGMNMVLNQATNVVVGGLPLSDCREKLYMPVVDYAKRGNFGDVSFTKATTSQFSYSTTLDEYELTNCHFIKIDVQGAEAKVLRGGQETIRKFKPVLYVENDVAEKSEELIELLLSMDYQLFWHFPLLYNPQNFFANPENVYNNIISINMICVPKHIKFAGDFPPVTDATQTWQSALEKMNQRL